MTAFTNPSLQNLIELNISNQQTPNQTNFQERGKKLKILNKNKPATTKQTTKSNQPTNQKTNPPKKRKTTSTT